MNNEISIKQTEHHHPPQYLLLRDLDLTIWTVFRFPVLAIILLYQRTLSKVLPGDTCRYYPSCSHYSYQAIYKYGVLRGVLMGSWRILRCNPFSQGGFDPVP
jgi:putative membrane protein insertion efficiency factor